MFEIAWAKAKIRVVAIVRVLLRANLEVKIQINIKKSLFFVKALKETLASLLLQNL